MAIPAGRLFVQDTVPPLESVRQHLGSHAWQKDVPLEDRFAIQANFRAHEVSQHPRDTNGMQADSVDRTKQLEWVKSMRKQFSPAGMLTDEGEINQVYFKPTQVVVLDGKKWGSEERDLLLKGLEKHGVGKWREIGEEFLQRWDDQALRVKAARLMGTQSLARYIGWKGDAEAVEAEFQKNKELGEATGCWKSGMLVEDDNGSVRKALEGLATAP